MKLEDLVQARALIETEFQNLSNPQWVATQIEQLKGKYNIYTQLIDNWEKDNAASSEKPAAKRSNSNNN